MLALLLAACTRSASSPLIAEEPSPTPVPLQPTETTAPSSPSPTTVPSATALPATATLAPPTATPAETSTALASATLPPLDPSEEYGAPTFIDSFTDDRYWANASGELPDTDFIRLALDSNRLLVTGKPPQFDTWWFTSVAAEDYFIEMEINTGECLGKQAYGLILRGPQSNASARGYILTFSCDGAYRLVRLDGLNPYTAVELIPWTENKAINAGANQDNHLGISLIESTISIFANKTLVEAIEDDLYASGRFGLFVNSGIPGNYTFAIDQLAFWDLD